MSPVEVLELAAVLLDDDLALDLQGGCQLAPILGEVIGQHPELLDLCVRLELGVLLLHGPLHSLDDLRVRSEEHTSELQSLTNLVCRLLLEKKKKTIKT